MDSTDPIAAKTQWTPLVPGGSNFVTHRLVQLDARRFEMKPSAGLKLFGAAFLMGGIGTFVLGFLISEWMVSVFGLPFAAAGGYVLWPRALVFDGVARLFTGKKGSVPFSGVHALQIVKETVTGSDHENYASYELNLVLTTGERINVTDHAGLVQLREDARKLSALLGCKVWDATASQ